MHKETKVIIVSICAKANTDLARVVLMCDGVKSSVIAKFKKFKKRGESYYKVFYRKKRLTVRAIFVNFSIMVGSLQ
jgi:hypothetical protein